jgi:hypothetical protein
MYLPKAIRNPQNKNIIAENSGCLRYDVVSLDEGFPTIRRTRTIRPMTECHYTEDLSVSNIAVRTSKLASPLQSISDDPRWRVLDDLVTRDGMTQ